MPWDGQVRRKGQWPSVKHSTSRSMLSGCGDGSDQGVVCERLSAVESSHRKSISDSAKAVAMSLVRKSRAKRCAATQRDPSEHIQGRHQEHLREVQLLSLTGFGLPPAGDVTGFVRCPNPRAVDRHPLQSANGPAGLSRP